MQGISSSRPAMFTFSSVTSHPGHVIVHWLITWFAGDVGGYMGLLLGGSVLTVFELLDLVIFNFVKKLIAQGKLPDPEEKRRKKAEKVGRGTKKIFGKLFACCFSFFFFFFLGGVVFSALWMAPIWSYIIYQLWINLFMKYRHVNYIHLTDKMILVGLTYEILLLKRDRKRLLKQRSWCGLTTTNME